MRRRIWIGSMGPFLYDDDKQAKGIIDEGGIYLTDASINKMTGTINVVTGINVTKDTVDGVEVVTDVTADVAELTYITDVTLETT